MSHLSRGDIIIAFLLLYIVINFLISKSTTSLSSSECDVYYIQNKKYYDTNNKNLFNDKDIRSQLFPYFKIISKSVNKNDCMFDIGSNVGIVTDIFHKYYPQNRIFLAEPLLLNYEATKRRFNLSKNVISINVAIGLKKEPFIWKYDRVGNMLMKYKKRYIFESNITFMYLDDFYNEYTKQGDIYFLKIDVEGYEDEVLFSAKKLLLEKKIKIIYFEYHYTCVTKPTLLVMYLEKLGYNCYLVGKHKIIKITYGCYFKIDSHILSHLLCFNNNINENLFINSYNKKYSKI